MGVKLYGIGVFWSFLVIFFYTGVLLGLFNCLIAENKNSKLFYESQYNYIENSAENLILKFETRLGNRDFISHKEFQIFWQTFLEDLKSNFNINLTHKESLVLIKRYLGILNLPTQISSKLKKDKTFLFFEKNLEDDKIYINPKRSQKRHPEISEKENYLSLHNTPHENTNEITTEKYPSSIYTGSVEILGGALLGILALEFPFLISPSATLVGYGIHKVLNGLEEINQDDVEFDYKASSVGFEN